MSENLTTRIVQRAGVEHLELEEAKLVVRKGPDKGAELALEPVPLRIGTAADCDLVLTDATVSGYHAEVYPEHGGHVIRDLGSTNGIRLGRWTVRQAQLGHRMKLDLGGSTLQVQTTTTPRSMPLCDAGEHGELVAHSPAMRALFAQIQQLAPSDLTILIEGETGAGKEVIARMVHTMSGRPGPLVVADLTAIAASLFAAELFGCEKGAFTGADQARPGLFEAAEGGTLFLDELGELPLDLQPTLLRAVERRTTRRVGGSKERKHDVRVVAATNRNLRQEVRQQTFREDLYYRMTPGRLKLPPLRARKEDIPLLARQFAEELGYSLTRDVMELLVNHRWPGNVRELRNTIERMAALPHGPLFDDVPLAGASESVEQTDGGGEVLALPLARRQATWAFERKYLTRVLELADNNVSRAAQLAGVSRSLISRMLRNHQDLTVEHG